MFYRLSTLDYQYKENIDIVNAFILKLMSYAWKPFRDVLIYTYQNQQYENPS